MAEEKREEYSSIHDGPSIDIAVSRALPGSAIDASIQTKPNPNLLDNWYFGNPVNQRGQTEYSGNQSFIIDRWCMRGDGVTIGLETDGLVINCDGKPFNSIVQAFESPSLLTGKTVTLSALVTENTNAGESIIEIGSAQNSSAAGTVLGETRFTGTGLFSVTVDIPISLANPFLTAIICAGNPATNGARFKIAAAKLELGTEQTLAHQDADGNWVLNEIPDYGEQLRRCQRYFRRRYAKASYGTIGTGVCASDTLAQINVPRTPMRIQPSVSVSGNIRIYAYYGVYWSPTEIKVDQISDFYIRLNCTISGGTPGQAIYAQALNNASVYIEEIADL